MKRAIYPGSFDPITFGHVDIVKRALSIFDELVIAISINFEKSPLFDLSERVSLVKQSFADCPQVSVESFDGLLVDFAKQKKIFSILRGLRAASDFEFEYQLAAMNRKLNTQVESVFLMTGSETYYLSSRLVKEAAFFGADVSKMVPPHIVQALSAKKHLRETKC